MELIQPQRFVQRAAYRKDGSQCDQCGESHRCHHWGLTAGECGALASVRFFGARDDVPELLGRMDLFAFCTTRSEGFGIALVEAMAAGTPIVASDVPACREVLAAGRDGVLVEAPSVASWSAALGSLIEDPARRTELALRATESVQARFSAVVCAGRWLEALGLARVR